MNTHMDGVRQLRKKDVVRQCHTVFCCNKNLLKTFYKLMEKLCRVAGCLALSRWPVNIYHMNESRVEKDRRPPYDLFSLYI